MTYERTSQIERADGSPGVISGILATDGEASDGHILNIAGMELPERAPLLFGHDDVTGTGNLGSWTEFDVEASEKPGESRIRGKASIELGGSGAQQAWRNDVSHMIEQGHISAFSVRWDPVGDPISRTSLPTDHFAYVDPKLAKGRAAWGLYFDSSRLLEGSVVTLGADPAALIGRMQESEGDLRKFWRSAVNYALTEAHEVSTLVGIRLDSGEVIYVERAARDAMLSAANERLAIALDLWEQVELEREMHAQFTSDDEQAVAARDDSTDAAPEQEAPTAPLPVVTPGEVLRDLREGLAAARAAEREERRALIDKARGKVNQ